QSICTHSHLHSFPTRRSSDLRFGIRHEPPYIVGAGSHSTSKLLRTLSMVAASKPTSWLSTCAHILLHLAGFGDLSGWSGLFPSRDRKSTRLNSSHRTISYAVF